MQKLSLDELLSLSVRERGKVVKEYANQLEIDKEIPEGLRASYSTYMAIEPYLADLATLNSNSSFAFLHGEKESITKSINTILNDKKPDIFKKIDKIRLNRKTTTIFELVNSEKLSMAQKSTRSISTMIGNILENIAHVAPNCMSPELDFGVKIAGLDLLIYAEDKIIQCQLKSNKDTLTGSQAKRSVKELSIFDNPYFASAYDTETSWHFPDISNVVIKDTDPIILEENKRIKELEKKLSLIQSFLDL